MATLPYLTNVDFRAGTRPAKQDGSPSLATKDDVAAWASEVDQVFQSTLGRNAGAVGHQYWTYDLMQDTGALIEDEGYSYERAKAMAIANMTANVARSAESAGFNTTGNANASPVATGAGTWNPTNNDERFNATPGGAGSELVTNDDGSQTYVPGGGGNTTYTSVALNQQPIQPAIYGGGGSNTTIVTGQGPQAKTAADQLRITPQDKVVLAGGNRLGDYSRQERKGRMGPIPGGRVGGGGVNIFG
tara:strand:- start:3124 stop:3861 length:738 start_codon:yes stop_codon:yes gene_type:complete